MRATAFGAECGGGARPYRPSFIVSALVALSIVSAAAVPAHGQSGPRPAVTVEGAAPNNGERPQPARIAAEPPGATVDALLALAQRFNPDLAAAVLESEAAIAKIAAAGALDDPMVTLTRDEGFRQTLLSASQEFPLWGKRDLRRDMARADAASVKGREGAVAQELAEQIKVTFAQYYLADRAGALTEDMHALLHSVAGTVRSRYAQGLGAQSDAVRADLERARLESELTAFERDREIATAKINALVARPSGSVLAKPSVLRRVPPVADLRLGDLIARAQRRNPALASARAEISGADAERQLIDKSWYPDVTVNIGADKLPGMSTKPVAGIGIKIPLQWGVRDAQTHAAAVKKQAAQARADGVGRKIESDLAAQLATLKQAQRSGDLLDKTLAPQSEAAYRSSLTSYQNGRGDLTAVLDSVHKQLEIRLELLRVQADEQMALAAIERIIGEDL